MLNHKEVSTSPHFRNLFINFIIRCTIFYLPVCYLKKYKYFVRQNYNFSCFLYGCKTWCLTMRKEHRLRLFENEVLREIFGPKRDAVTGDWRRQHTE